MLGTAQEYLAGNKKRVSIIMLGWQNNIQKANSIHGKAKRIVKRNFRVCQGSNPRRRHARVPHPSQNIMADKGGGRRRGACAWATMASPPVTIFLICLDRNCICSPAFKCASKKEIP
jgi:hypothetical protein